MQFSIPRALLRSALIPLRRAAGSRRGPAALRHVLIQTELGTDGRGRTRFTTTNLNLVLTFSTEVDDARPGTASLPVDDLYEQTRGRLKEVLTIRTSGRNRAEVVKNGVLSATLSCLPRDEMPPLPPVPKLARVDGSFLNQLHRAASFCSADESRASICGVHVDQSKRTSNIVATDGHRLMALPAGRLPSTIRESVTIPVCGIPAKVFLAEEKAVMVGNDRKSFAFHKGPWAGSIQLVAGTYPDWRQVIPKSGGRSRIVIPDTELGDVADFLRKLPVAKETSDPIALVSRCGRLLIRYASAGGKVHETALLKSQLHGAAFGVVVNRQFLIESIRAGFGIISFGGDGKPLDLRSAAKGERVVLMPLRHSGLTTVSSPTAARIRKSAPRSKPKPRKVPVSSTQPASPLACPALIQQLQDACVVAKATIREAAGALNEVNSLAKQLARAQKHSASEVSAARKTLAKLKALSF